jgi:hypothetical protein
MITTSFLGMLVILIESVPTSLQVSKKFVMMRGKVLLRVQNPQKLGRLSSSLFAKPAKTASKRW